jgi:hypothetical protein
VPEEGIEAAADVRSRGIASTRVGMTGRELT